LDIIRYINSAIYWAIFLKWKEEKASNPLIGTWEMRYIERLVEIDHHFTLSLKK
jgi:hypothetical protein|tara:strand:- start:1033 stop:1194 length:162 start_codon:yes stop_codon:yes gene_type:complete